MDLVQISNLFNQIAQASTLKFYHYGWTSDQNINISNNFTGDNTRGKKYPALHLDFPTRETVEVKLNDVRTQGNYFLIFSDTQHYNSEDGSTNLRSIIEVHRDLKNLAIAVLNEFNRLARLGAGKNRVGLIGNPTFTYTANALNDRLVQVFVEFSLFYLDDCPTLTVDPSTLPAPYNDVPPSQNDYEILK